MKIKSSKVLKSLMAVILAVLMIVGTTVTGFARELNITNTGDTYFTVYITPNTVTNIKGGFNSDGTLKTGYQLKLWANAGGDSDCKQLVTMTKVQGVTFGGNVVYTASAFQRYNGLDELIFQLFYNNNWNAEYKIISSWSTDSSWYGKVFDNNSWKTYNPDPVETLYDITVSAGTGGSVSPTSVKAGSTTKPTITATPNSGFVFDKWTVTGGANVASTTSESTTVSATATGTVKANFTENPYLTGGDIIWLKKPTSYDWSNTVNVYLYGGSKKESDWPGPTMTKFGTYNTSDGDRDYYFYVIPGNKTDHYYNVVFSKNGSDSDKTNDIDIAGGSGYGYDIWYDNGWHNLPKMYANQLPYNISVTSNPSDGATSYTPSGSKWVVNSVASGFTDFSAGLDIDVTPKKAYSFDEWTASVTGGTFADDKHDTKYTPASSVPSASNYQTQSITLTANLERLEDEFYLKQANSDLNEKFEKKGDNYEATVTLNSSIEPGNNGLYIKAPIWDIEYWKNNGKFTRENCTGWVLDGNDSTSNFGIEVDEPGDYTFVWHPGDKKLDVIYPTLQTYSVTLSQPLNANITKVTVSDGTSSIELDDTSDIATFEKNKEITVSAVTTEGYVISSWGETGATISNNKFVITGDVTLNPTVESRWKLKGFDNWTNGYELLPSGYSKTINITSSMLSDNDEFKIYDKQENKWYTINTSDRQVKPDKDNLTVTYSTTEGGSDNNTKLIPSVYGDYTFTWNTTENKLSVTYPLSYFAKASGKNNEGGTDIGASNKVVVTPPSDSDKAENYFAPGSDVTFVATNLGESFKFEGWYDNNNTLLTTNLSYTVTNISENKEIYALYSRRLRVKGTAVSNDSTPSAKEMTFIPSTGIYSVEIPGYHTEYNEGQLRILYNNNDQCPAIHNLTAQGNDWIFNGTGISMWLPEGFTESGANDSNIYGLDSTKYQAPYTITMQWDPTKSSGSGGYVMGLSASLKKSKNVAVDTTYALSPVTVQGDGANPVGNQVTVTLTTVDDEWIENTSDPLGHKDISIVNEDGTEFTDFTVTPSSNSNDVTVTFTMPNNDVTINVLTEQLYTGDFRKFTNGASSDAGFSSLTLTGQTKVVNDQSYFKAGATAVYTVAYAGNYSFAGYYKNQATPDFSKKIQEETGIVGTVVVDGNTLTYTYPTTIEAEAAGFTGFNVIANMYHNVYYKKTNSDWDAGKELMKYDPVKNQYWRDLEADEGFTGIGLDDGSDDFYLSTTGDSITPIWESEFNEVGTGITVWHGGNSHGGRNRLHSIASNYQLPVKIIMQAYPEEGGNPTSYGITGIASEKIEKTITIQNYDQTGISEVKVGETKYEGTPIPKYVGSKVVVSFTMSSANNYLDWDNTTIVKTTDPTTDIKNDCTYNEEGNTITFNMADENVIITPVLKTKYKVEYQVVQRGYYNATESDTFTTSITVGGSPVTSGSFVDAGSDVSFNASNVLDINWEVYGFFKDATLKDALPMTEGSYIENDISKDTKVYVLFVRKLWLSAWDDVARPDNPTIVDQQPMNYDPVNNRFYLDNVEFTAGADDTGKGYRFKIFDTPNKETQGSDDCWDIYASVPQEGPTKGINISRNKNGSTQEIEDAYLWGMHAGYDSPISIYYDLGLKSSDNLSSDLKYSVYVRAKYVGAQIYLSSGVDMTAQGQDVSNFSNSEYVSPVEGDAGTEFGSVINIIGTDNTTVNEKVQKLTLGSISDVTVKTTISADEKDNYYVVDYVYYNSKTNEVGKVDVASECNDTGIYQATIPIEVGYYYIVPIFVSANANNKVYVDTSDLSASSTWGPLVASYFYGGNIDGQWPGQLMIPTENKNQFVAYLETAKDNELMVVNNYMEYTAFGPKHSEDIDSKEYLNINNRILAQTYDFEEYTILSNNEVYKSNQILFKIKENEDGYHGQFPEEANMNSPVQIKQGESITPSDSKWKWQYLQTKDGSNMSLLGLHTNSSLGYYVVSEGDIDKSETKDTDWYVNWHIYKADGTYICTVPSNALYNHGDGSTTNDIITTLASKGITYKGEAVKISYEKVNNAPGTESRKGHAPAYDGQWYAMSPTEPYTVSIVPAELRDDGTIVENPDAGTATISYAGYTSGGTTINPFEDEESGEICLANPEVTAKATASANYTFYKFYPYDKKNAFAGDKLTSLGATTFYAVFELTANAYGSITYQYKDRFGNDKTYVYKHRFEQPEKDGYLGNGGKAKSLTYKLHYHYTDGSDSWGIDPGHSDILPGKTLDHTDDFYTSHAPTSRQADVYMSNISWARADQTTQPDEGQDVVYIAKQTPLEYTVVLHYPNGDEEPVTGPNGKVVVANAEKCKDVKYWSNNAEGTQVLTKTKDFKMTIVPTEKDDKGSYESFHAYAMTKEPSSDIPWAANIDSIQKFREIEGTQGNIEDILYTDTYARFSNKDAQSIANYIQSGGTIKYGVVYLYDDYYSTIGKDGRFVGADHVWYPNSTDWSSLDTYLKYVAFNNATDTTKTYDNHKYHFKCVQYKDGEHATKFNRLNQLFEWDYTKQRGTSYVAYSYVILGDVKAYTDLNSENFKLSSASNGYCYNEE